MRIKFTGFCKWRNRARDIPGSSVPPEQQLYESCYISMTFTFCAPLLPTIPLQVSTYGQKQLNSSRFLPRSRTRKPCPHLSSVGFHRARVSMSLTSLPCTAGGLVIGLVAAWNAAIHGRVTGISGSFTRALKSVALGGRLPYDDVLFVAGLIVGGAVFAQIMPASFGGAFVGSIARIALAGFAVGFGTGLANGCTSGHGVCGLARLSMRSVLNVIVFILTAMATATLVGTGNLYRSLETSSVQPAAFSLGQTSVGVIAVFVIPLLLAIIVRYRETLREKISKLLYFGFGVAFAYGLSVAQMTRSQKVVGFLDILSSHWDPSLLFVFVGALPVAFIGFQRLIRQQKKPLFCDRSNLPTSTSIDKKLVFGGMMFGFGWGLEGYCPGPALVNLGANPFNPNIIIFCAALASGALLSELRKKRALESKA